MDKMRAARLVEPLNMVCEDADLFDEGASGASRPSRNATDGLAINATIVEGRGEGGTCRLPVSDGTSSGAGGRTFEFQDKVLTGSGQGNRVWCKGGGFPIGLDRGGVRNNA